MIPNGRPRERVTFPEKPSMLLAVMVTPDEPPWGNVRKLGFAESWKLGPVTVT